MISNIWLTLKLTVKSSYQFSKCSTVAKQFMRDITPSFPISMRDTLGRCNLEILILKILNSMPSHRIQ